MNVRRWNSYSFPTDSRIQRSMNLDYFSKLTIHLPKGFLQETCIDFTFKLLLHALVSQLLRIEQKMGASFVISSLSILVILTSMCHRVGGLTNNEDLLNLNGLKAEWKDTVPPNWGGADPCGSLWDGVNCSNSTVISLKLSTMGLKGILSSAIGFLSGLRTLDLSYNKDLSGSIPSSLGNLIHLESLMMIGCGFTGRIPNELGNLLKLNFLALNSNGFSGPIPPSLGNLSQIRWLDLADNLLDGSFPVSNKDGNGLDNLHQARHFHFNNNQLTGKISSDLFHSKMQLIHLLLDGNGFIGEIPHTLGLVESLEIVHLSNNNLNRLVPDLSNLTRLQYIDLSNNSFDSWGIPQWLPTLQQLTTIAMENVSLKGEINSKILELPCLETLNFRNNALNGTFRVTDNASRNLIFIDLENNKLSRAPMPKDFTLFCKLMGNPVCNTELSLLPNTSACQSNHRGNQPYTTPLTPCRDQMCSGEFRPNPRTCQCQIPYEGTMKFRAVSFSDLSNASRFKELENSLAEKLGVDSVLVRSQNFDNQKYLSTELQIFPVNETSFRRSQIIDTGYTMASQSYKAPSSFETAYFLGDTYFVDNSVHSSRLNSKATIIMSIGAAVSVVVIVCVGFYALMQKKRADSGIQSDHPFANWDSKGEQGCRTTVPKLKGARVFSFMELERASCKFSKTNEIGSGGYGKVYKAILSGGEVVAIKRANRGSLQGRSEFKNEIELLSRVHHRNLVGLIGFCFEKEEQMLVYEYISNGTLRENLHGGIGIRLDWRRRLLIALGSARGLNYLHELANPPIIHRDVKSSNILLDDKLVAKVADFGISKLVADGGVYGGGKSYVSTQVKGTMGYLDPEYFMTLQLTEKSDVYSFGVVLLELITARPAVEREKQLVQEVKMSLQLRGIGGFRHELMDPFLKGSLYFTGLENLLNLALRCVEELPLNRPTMNGVVKELESIVEDERLLNSISSRI